MSIVRGSHEKALSGLGWLMHRRTLDCTVEAQVDDSTPNCLKGPFQRLGYSGPLPNHSASIYAHLGGNSVSPLG